MTSILGIAGLHRFYIVHHVIEALFSNHQTAALVTAIVVGAFVIYAVIKHFK